MDNSYIDIGLDGIKRKHFTDKNGKKRSVILCKTNNCDKEEKKRSGYCLGCLNNRDKTVFLNRQEGEIFIANNIRYKISGKQPRKLCITQDENGEYICNTAYKDFTSQLCDGHLNNNIKLRNRNVEKGTLIEHSGEMKMFNGAQLIKLCKHPNCQIPVTYQGKCKKHSPHWWCKFTYEPCTSIRVDKTDYCAIHKNNIQNSKVKSKGEQIIADYLDMIEVNYVSNSAVQFEGRTIFPDFILTDYNLAIELDGKQHFYDIAYWGSQEGLELRKQCDERKDRWARSHTNGLLRISFTDTDHVSTYIDIFLMLYADNEIDQKIISTKFDGYINRDYHFLVL